MWRYAVGLAVFGMVAAQFLNNMNENLEASARQDGAEATYSQAENPSEPRETSVSESYSGRTARIKMDQRGHFVTTARMNGRQIEVLVDTGATSVAINKTIARRLGINLKASDFKYTVNTANGKTKAASALIERISIGRVEVRNVQAAVLDDRALSGTLLGMSFLGQLDGFEVRNRELILTQ